MVERAYNFSFLVVFIILVIVVVGLHIRMVGVQDQLVNIQNQIGGLQNQMVEVLNASYAYDTDNCHQYPDLDTAFIKSKGRIVGGIVYYHEGQYPGASPDSTKAFQLKGVENLDFIVGFMNPDRHKPFVVVSLTAHKADTLFNGVRIRETNRIQIYDKDGEVIGVYNNSLVLGAYLVE